MITAPAFAAIARACRLLRDGQVIGLPTETVYGLAGDACRDEAVSQIYALKGRPPANPLIVHVSSREAAEKLAEISPGAQRLMDAFWPGPLTLVLPKTRGCPVSVLATGGLDTIAVRCPSHIVARQILEEFKGPLAAPSANPSTGISPTTAGDVAACLGDKVPLILDGGPCEVGLESTILDLSGAKPVLLRPGTLTLEHLAAVIGPVQPFEKGQPVKAPGMMERHYAPRRPLRLNALDCRPGEALLGFGCAGEELDIALNLSLAGNLEEAAANLFHMMRKLDTGPYEAIAVMPIPPCGIGAAINDRLERAAAPLPEKLKEEKTP